ncbi:MAG: DUF1330 domain-containing protein [Paracoccaceae bacterium]|nr:DUF1330 domain-containing protein [Paracoccaceae bacterium]MDE2911315.1 DUF1330 domain-containing protein [Paracoccaceae bacterium]
MAVYAIVRVDVHDSEEYARYAAIAGRAVEDHGGEFLARGGPCEHLEGTGRARNVIIRFPDMETARTFYHSADYQKALSYGLPASTRDYTLVEGV